MTIEWIIGESTPPDVIQLQARLVPCGRSLHLIIGDEQTQWSVMNLRTTDDKVKVYPLVGVRSKYLHTDASGRCFLPLSEAVDTGKLQEAIRYLTEHIEIMQCAHARTLLRQALGEIQ